MKRLLFSLLFVSISLLTAEARHIIGGSMAYYYQGESLFIRMTLYRDCFGGGAPFDVQAPVGIYRNGELYTTLTTNDPVIESLDTLLIVAGCPTPVCVEKGSYLFEVSLPATDLVNTYTVVYQRCCHANTIANLLDPSMVGNTFSVQITPEARSVKNNAPVWPTEIPLVVCAHQPVALQLAATDAEGDSLFYSLCGPLAGGGPILIAPGLTSCEGAVPSPPCAPPYNTVAFVSPTYSSTNPFDAENLSISAQTGLLQFIPHTIGQFIYAVCVEERRNGQVLGNVQRELILYVVDGSSPTTEAMEVQPLEISPNPTSSEITVGMKNFDGQLVEMTITDATGKAVFFQKKRVNAAETLAVSHLLAGTYSIRVVSEGASASGFFVRL